jgi:hypothetical protein
MDASEKRIMAGNSYEFEELEGRTLAELEGLVLYQDLMEIDK